MNFIVNFIVAGGRDMFSKNAHYPDEDRDMMRQLLQTGGNAFLETIEKRENPVQCCSKSRNTINTQEIISLLQLIDAQLACNKQAKSGWTPLFYSCSNGHSDIIRMLLKHNVS